MSGESAEAPEEEFPSLPAAAVEFMDARGGMDRALLEMRQRSPQAFMAMQTAFQTQLKAETKMLLAAAAPALPVHQGRVQVLTAVCDSFTLFESRLVRAQARKTASGSAGQAR
jgi:hypothetical protein